MADERELAEGHPGGGEEPSAPVSDRGPASERASDHAWEASPPRRVRTALLSLTMMTVLGGAGWLGSGHLLERRARQQVADRWEALRICLIGEANRQRPSEALRLARLAVEHAPEGLVWPSRCLPYAAAFDEARQPQAVPAELRQLPSATDIVESPALRSPELDEIADAVEAADLPLPAPQPDVAPAPTGAPPRLSSHRLESFAAVERLDAIVASPPAGGELRFLVPDAQGLRLCRIDDELRCRAVPLEPAAEARLDLATGPARGGDLLQLRDTAKADGFYDAATGLAVWRSSYFDTQAVVDSKGIAVLSARLHEEARGEGVETFELVRIAPGKRPRAARLGLSSDAHALLLPGLLLSWQDGERHAEVRAQRYDEARTEASAVVAELPLGTRRVAHCGEPGAEIILLADGIRDRRYSLLVRRGETFSVVPVGVIAGRVELSCQRGEAWLERLRDGVATRWRCRDRCQQETTGALAALGAPVADVQSIGESLVVLWSEPGGPLRMRIGKPAEMAEQRDVLLLDSASRTGLELLGLRILDGGVALLQDASLKLYALRIDERGGVTPLRALP